MRLPLAMLFTLAFFPLTLTAASSNGRSSAVSEGFSPHDLSGVWTGAQEADTFSIGDLLLTSRAAEKFHSVKQGYIPHSSALSNGSNSSFAANAGILLYVQSTMWNWRGYV